MAFLSVGFGDLYGAIGVSHSVVAYQCGRHQPGQGLWL
jgi:hypothetical protein